MQTIKAETPMNQIMLIARNFSEKYIWLETYPLFIVVASIQIFFHLNGATLQRGSDY
jgi:hypothetical protein